MNRKNKKEKDPINIFVMFRKIYPLAAQASLVYTIVWIIIGIAHGVSHGVSVLVSQKFYDSINNAVSSSSAFDTVLGILIIYGVVLVFTQILNGIHNFMSSMMWQKVNGHFNYLINKKCSRIAPVEYENPGRHDDINKAGEGAGNAISFVFTTSTLFTFYVPYFLFMSVYLYSLHPVLIFSILLVFLPVLISQILRSPIYARLEDKAAPIRREYDFYEQAAVDKVYFKETRLLGAYGYFKDLFYKSLVLLNKAGWKAHVKSANIDLGLQLLSIAGRFGIMYLLFYLLLAGEITVGVFAAVFSSIGMLFGVMEEIIKNHIGNLTQNFGLIRNFLRFLDIPERDGAETPIDIEKGIAAENVFFKYPQSDVYALSDVSLKINCGETLAVVGENGAGKTTLVKLLIGIYTPVSGSISIGGADTVKASADSIFRKISGVFQRYQRYQFNLERNVRISDIYKTDDTGNVLSISGVDADDKNVFPDGKETMLSRDFDGVDLSGGQWQRVAIARGFYRTNDIIVLDEPTAAIDPLEENRIYRKFAEIAKDKTAVIVTHRLASAKIADRIVVMEKGCIADIGSHDELMERDGLYARMYNAQSVWYDSADV